MKKIVFLLTLSLFALSPAASGQKFYPDDPLLKEPAPRLFKQPANRKLSDYYDLFSHQFGPPGEVAVKLKKTIPAQAVNTLGEPMEGAWWEQRHYYKRMSREELQRGPGGNNAPSTDGQWTVIGAKNEGVTPGFVILDAKKRRYFIKFDPLTNPNMATACDAIVTRIVHALGYHVPENYLVYFSPEQLELGEDVELLDKRGKPQKMTRRDLLEILLKVPKTSDGKYRATASYSLPGKTIGPPRYYGTRADDPNDIVPHEHRRDLRGFHVISAWLGHDDSRAINNVDVFVKQQGELGYIKHFLLDFGSALGSGTQKPNSPRSGAYFFDWGPAMEQMFTLGLKPQYWALAKYPKLPEVGRFEWKTFDPEKWLPEYPNPAFLNRLPDDEFWGAKLVTAFTDEDLKALVETGQYADPKSTAWVLECLIERRNKIGRAYFNKVLPLDQFRMEGGKLTWVDLGAKLGYTKAAEVDMAWSDFAPGIRRAKLTSKANPKQVIDVFVRNSEVIGIERYW
ncbi:MAG: hypothetical protein NW208_01500 [Bryobacter sp.]|nr:hypothetical protein [Bryobacter sp.]